VIAGHTLISHFEVFTLEAVPIFERAGVLALRPIPIDAVKMASASEAARNIGAGCWQRCVNHNRISFVRLGGSRGKGTTLPRLRAPLS